MNDGAAQIVTTNFDRLSDEYYSRVFLPAFAAVESGRAPVERFFRVAGRTLKLRFHDPALEEKMAPALAHAAVAPVDLPDLAVDIWDSAGSGAHFVSPRVLPEYLRHPENGSRKSAVQGIRGVFQEFEQSMTFYDAGKRQAHFWVRDAARLPYWVSAAPLRTLLHWLLSETDAHLLHGAAVASGGRAALLAAKGGSGKSTTALSCLLSGMDYLADDYAAVRLGDVPAVHALYSSVKVAPQRVADFGEIGDRVWNQEGDKSIIFLADLYPERLPISAPLAAIMIPVISFLDRTEIVPAGRAAALLALLPTTVMQLPLAETGKLRILTELVSRVPCHFLHLGRDSREAAAAVKEFLEHQDIV